MGWLSVRRGGTSELELQEVRIGQPERVLGSPLTERCAALRCDVSRTNRFSSLGQHLAYADVGQACLRLVTNAPPK